MKKIALLSVGFLFAILSHAQQPDGTGSHGAATQQTQDIAKVVDFK